MARSGAVMFKNGTPSGVRAPLNLGADRLVGGSGASGQQPREYCAHGLLAVTGPQVQDPHVAEIGLVAAAGQECIVGTAELKAREERFAEHIAAEGAGLAHQSMDDVAVVDPVCIAAPKRSMTATCSPL